MIAVYAPADKLNPNANTKPRSWDVYDDVEEFVEVVIKKINEMRNRKHPTKKRKLRKEALSGNELKRVIMAVWHVCFCGIQWRSIAYMTSIPLSTIYSFFSRWTERGLWKELLGDLIEQWRAACGDTGCPKVLLIDSRSCRSAPTG